MKTWIKTLVSLKTFCYALFFFNLIAAYGAMKAGDIPNEIYCMGLAIIFAVWMSEAGRQGL